MSKQTYTFAQILEFMLDDPSTKETESICALVNEEKKTYTLQQLLIFKRVLKLVRV